MWSLIGFFIVIIIFLSVESQLRKANNQNEEMIELLKQINEKINR